MANDHRPIEGANYPILIKAHIQGHVLTNDKARRHLYLKIERVLADINVDVAYVESDNDIVPDPLTAPLDGTAE